LMETVPRVAVIVTVVPEVTCLAVIAKLLVVAPWGTVTLDGAGRTDEFELDRDTAAPPASALPLIVTVPIVVPPSYIWLGLTVKPTSLTGCRTSGTTCVEPAAVAEILTVVSFATFAVVIEKVAEVLPEWIVTEDGTDARPGLDEVRLTTTSEEALPTRVRVPVTELPPTTGLGFKVMAATFWVKTLREAVFCAPL